VPYSPAGSPPYAIAASRSNLGAVNSSLAIALITVVVVLGVVVELRYFNRNTWALVIVLSFPIGPALYLRYAKGPRRYL
jgi:hypothetical protein